jgi:hypothetical protein
MSSYRFLEDAWVGQFYYQAGTIASTTDVGGTLPVNWVPSGNTDPLDTGAVNSFYNAGPQQCGLVRDQWNGTSVQLPTTYWKPVVGSSPTQWALTGLGVLKAPVFE